MSDATLPDETKKIEAAYQRDEIERIKTARVLSRMKKLDAILQDDEFKEVAAALGMLLAEVRRIDALQQWANKGAPLARDHADMPGDDDDDPVRTRRRQIDAILHNPIRAACMNAIGLLAHRCCTLGMEQNLLFDFGRRVANDDAAFDHDTAVLKSAWHRWSEYRVKLF